MPVSNGGVSSLVEDLVKVLPPLMQVAEEIGGVQLPGIFGKRATDVPLLKRSGWVRDTIAILEEAKRLSGGQVFVVTHSDALARFLEGATVYTLQKEAGATTIA